MSLCSRSQSEVSALSVTPLWFLTTFWSFLCNNTKTSSVGLSQLVRLKRLKEWKSICVCQTDRAFTSSSHNRLQCFWFISKCCRPGLFWQQDISEYLRYVFNIWMLRLEAVWNSNQFIHWEKCWTAGCLMMHSGGEARAKPEDYKSLYSQNLNKMRLKRKICEF